MKLMNLGVAVEKVEKKVDETQRMILIPDSIKISSKYNEGIVKFVGRGFNDRPMEVRPGERIMYKKAIYPTSEGLDVIHLDDILYVVED